MTTYQILSLLGIPSLLAAVLLGVFNWGKARAIKKLREQEETRTNKDKEHNLLMDGVVAILHNMVYTQGKAHIARGKITFEDMKDYEYLYNAYHAMGGNGTGTEIYNRVKDLPTEQAEGVQMKISDKTRKWFKAAGVRAVKTMAQTFIATVGSAAVLSAVDWKVVLSAAVLAGILSVATSVAGLPEIKGSEV